MLLETKKHYVYIVLYVRLLSFYCILGTMTIDYGMADNKCVCNPAIFDLIIPLKIS